MYICPVCKKLVSKDVRRLIYHLKHVHAFCDSQDYTLTCSQENCPRTYNNFGSYSKHLKRCHSHSNLVDLELHDYASNLPSTSSTPTAPTNSSAPTAPTNSENETDNNEESVETLLDDKDYLKKCVGVFVAKTYSASNATQSDVQKHISIASDLIDETLSSLQQQTVDMLNMYSIPLNDQPVQSLMQNFESARNMFEEVDSTYKMSKYFTDNLSIVEAKEIFLGHRAETTRRQGKFSQTLAADTCQYISVIDTVKFLFSCEHFERVYRQSNNRYDDRMHDYSDGLVFKRHELYKNQPNALQIQLYFDDFETTNPLGSKTKIHKMGAVYFCIRNLPSEYNSALNNIHLCLLFNSIDKDTYGLKKIFEPLLDDLRFLETKGIEVEIGGQITTLFGTVCILTADNLACHTLGGFVESFSANRFCRYCMVDKQMAQQEFDDDRLEMRNKDNYQLHVSEKNPAATGVKEDSCLNTLKYFHITEHVGVDVMHDLLEGVAPLEIKLMLQQFIYVEELFTLEQFNDRIVSTDYGYSNEKNKPNVIINLRTADNPVKQTASQMWCLLIFLPMLIGDFVSHDSQHWKLYVMLRDICDIAFAPVVTKGMAILLKQLTIDHHRLFKSIYPERNIIPKHHFMIHYWRLMFKFGPLVKLWCMRFEGKHNPLKKHAHVVCNFINISKTLAFKNQIKSMFDWKFGEPLDKKLKVPNTFQVMVGSLVKHEQFTECMKSFGQDISICSRVNLCSSVEMFGHSFKTGGVIALNNDLNGERLFGQITYIVPVSESVDALFFLQIITVKYFDDHLHSYVVEKTNEFEMVNLKNIAYVLPLDLFTHRDSEKHIILRYKLV